jgi:chromosome segregation ATPase
LSSLALLVDADERLRPVLEKHLGSDWQVVLEGDADAALQRGPLSPEARAPDLIVLNVDVAKGWSLCTQVKRRFQSVPVIVVSYRLGKDVFNNHQKLESRADAYHRIPEEMDSLEITLGYFASHRSEIVTDASPMTGESRRPEARPRSGQRLAVPSGIVVKLETTVGEQARELENLRRQIEALEAERDAMSDKSRRQMMDLMALAPSSSDQSGETKALMARISELEAEGLLASRREDEVRELRRELDRMRGEGSVKSAKTRALEAQKAKADESLRAAQHAHEAAIQQAAEERRALEAKIVALQAEKALGQAKSKPSASAPTASPGMVAELEAARASARKEATDAADQLASAGAQLSNLANELATTHRARLAAEAALREAEARAAKAEASHQQQHAGQAAETEAMLAELTQRAETAERAWSAVNARAEGLAATLAAKTIERDKTAKEKAEAETALNTSRKLIREYAAEAARRADDLRALEVKFKELETRCMHADAARSTAIQAVEFERSLVASLEKEMATVRATSGDHSARATEIASLRAELADRVTVHKALEISFAKLRTSAVAQTEMLVSRVKELAAWGRALEARLAEVEGGRVAARAKLDGALSDLRGGTTAVPPKPLVDAPVLPDFSKI